ncbi:MAG: DUF1284 domain-containing protein [Fermentimonas sp.]|jgi:hypothetical protein
MENKRISRRKFIANSTCGGLLVLAPTCEMTSCTRAKEINQSEKNDMFTETIFMRPYQLLCMTCAVGGGNTNTDSEKLKLIKENPDSPVTLLCNAGDIFSYQDPGPADDAHGDAVFNRKRDLEILQRIDLPPGITLPARILLHRMWDRIESVSGICDGDETTPQKQVGCPLATSECYKKGREISLLYATPGWNSQLDFSEADIPKTKETIIRPRTKEERAKEKEKSLKAMYEADAIAVRPHILLCAICQYGLGDRPPFETDNLPEMLQFIFENPNAKIKIAEAADWMMCAPCPSLNKHGACFNVKGRAGLTSQLRDVRVLQKLNLSYGDEVNAQELYRLIIKRIPSSAMICGSISKGVEDPSVWDDECGHHSESLPEYIKGRELLARKFGVEI